MEKNKNIDYILMSEKIPGEINIEDLIKKIKFINQKISIIFFLEKEDINKKDKLKKLGIKNIYINNKINRNKIINKIEESKTKINNKKNKIIIIDGEPKSGKTTIINLLLINLMNNNKKILIINLNNKIEKNYLILLGKKYFKNKEKNIHKIKNKKELKNIEIKINRNLFFVFPLKQNLEKIKNEKEYIKNFFKKYKEKYDYILVDSGKNSNLFWKQEIIKKSEKKVIVIDNNFIDIKKIREIVHKGKEENWNKESLCIIQNKYNNKTISYSIIKNIFGKDITIYKILYHKKYKNLVRKISKKEDFKINKFMNKQIEKILN